VQRNFNFFSKQDAIVTLTKTIFYTYVCTGRSAAVSEHRTRNPAITSLMRYRYTNFLITLNTSVQK